MTPGQDAFNDILVQIAQSLVEAAGRSEARAGQWRQVSCDVRYSAMGNQLKKFRIGLKDGTSMSCPEPTDSDKLFDDLWASRNQGLVQNWFGIAMTVGSGGECETNFNFDPRCMADGSFFED